MSKKCLQDDTMPHHYIHLEDSFSNKEINPYFFEKSHTTGCFKDSKPHHKELRYHALSEKSLKV